MTPTPSPVLVQPRLWSESATIRFNAALLVLCVGGVVWSRDRRISACFAAGICVALSNLALRFKTTGPLTLHFGGVDLGNNAQVTGGVAGENWTYTATGIKRRAGF